MVHARNVPFNIQPVKGWTITIFSWGDPKKIDGKLRVFDSGGWEIILAPNYNTGGNVRWLPEDRRSFSPGGDKLMMVLDNRRTYDKNQPFGVLHGGWTKPVISLGSIFNGPPQPWFSQTGIRKGVFELTSEWKGYDHNWILV
jgi:hypothetical protein